MLLVETDVSHVEVWRLNSEANRNALSKNMVTRLSEELARVSKTKEVRAVVVTGAGDKAFCSGADLKERAGMTPDEVKTFLELLRETFRGFERSDTVFSCFVNGVAFGGGTELALSCDYRVMSASTEMGLTEVKLGIIPGAGGTQRLPRLIGKARAKDLVLSGRRVTAEEAERLGLVNKVGTFEDALEWARAVALNAPIAVGLAKHAIDDGLHLSTDEALTLEQNYYAKTLGTSDRLEGLKAFAEKRKPNYLGR